MSSARKELLDRVISHVATNGMMDTSLRTLAAAIGTSHRMLIYHFRSREGLLAATVHRIEHDQRVALEHLARTAESPAALIRTQWAQLTDPALIPFIRLFFEVFAYASLGREGTEGFLENVTDPWIEMAGDVAARMGLATTEAELRLGVAVSRGLLMEVVAGADVATATESLERYLEIWEHASR
jgi:AcrR family transcriptional regulator